MGTYYGGTLMVLTLKETENRFRQGTSQGILVLESTSTHECGSTGTRAGVLVLFTSRENSAGVLVLFTSRENSAGVLVLGWEYWYSLPLYWLCDCT